VLDTEGAVLVIAGAGSGKTRVLTTRIAYLVSEKKVPADRILAITFTNKAAGEMKERLTKILGDIPQMWVCTIHSMCVRILRRDIDVLGYDKNFTIYDETDRDRLIKKVLDDLGYDSDKIFKPSKTYISIAKNECLSPDEFLNEYSSLKFAEEIHNVYKLYQNYLERSNSLDFDDLLFLTNKLFVEYPDVAEYYANKFEYVHIDEFQDTNSVQFNICRVLTKKHGNIFAVGDDDQSIYGWRGARIENILSFDDVYRGAKVYKLEQNYRSTKKILKLANTIIANNKGRRVKELWTDNDEGCKVETFVAGDENNEASYVAMQIKSLYSRSETLRYKDFAVFMRVNALSRAVEQDFLKYGIPYKVYGGFRFFERKEIKDVLSYLKVINNHYDNESFIRAVSSPKRGIGDTSIEKLNEIALRNRTSLKQVVLKFL
jgi:DNA helicase-2/ATP-dependent DNA helicase PcrA